MSGAFRFTVYGDPAPKGSRTPGKRKDGSIYTRPASKREEPWTLAVEGNAAAWMREPIPPPPYRVTLEFYLAKPKRPSNAWPSKADLDKYERCTLDGLVRAGMLLDDRHVTELSSVKRWAATPSGACCRITIERDEHFG